MELYIIRHGETDWNNLKRLQGRSDVALNDYGVELAEITSDALKDIDFDVIYSSPLKRAYDTASILRRDRNIEIIKDDRLVEMSFGDFEGVPVSRLPKEFALFFEAPEKFTPAPNGESYQEVVERAKDFIDNVVMKNVSQINRMMIVAHGALNRALMINLNHQGIKDYWSGIFQRNCCVNIYDIHDNEAELLVNGKIFYEEKEGKRYK